MSARDGIFLLVVVLSLVPVRLDTFRMFTLSPPPRNVWSKRTAGQHILRKGGPCSAQTETQETGVDDLRESQLIQITKEAKIMRRLVRKASSRPARPKPL